MAYHRPETLDAALALLAEGPRLVLAGGTDVFPATSRRELSGEVLDVTGIAALRGIGSDGHGGVRIGAAATWSDLIAAPLPPAFDGLKLAAREVGSVQIQNAGTLGGNLCNASPAADGAPPLMTLDAEVELQGARGARRLRLAEFLLGPRRTALEAGELLTAIVVPAAACAGRATFLKLGARRHLVISIAMVAARIEIEGGRIASAALSVGACGPVAATLPLAEAVLLGRPADAGLAALVTDADVTAALSPIDDLRGDAPYRARAAAELVRRAVAALVAPQAEAAA